MKYSFTAKHILKLYGCYFWTKWRIPVLIGFSAILLIAAALAKWIPPQYGASARIQLMENSSETDALYRTVRVKSMAEYFKSNLMFVKFVEISERIVSQPGSLTDQPGEKRADHFLRSGCRTEAISMAEKIKRLHKHLKLSPNTNTDSLTFTLTDTSPEMATQQLNQMLDLLLKEYRAVAINQLKEKADYLKREILRFESKGIDLNSEDDLLKKRNAVRDDLMNERLKTAYLQYSTIDLASREPMGAAENIWMVDHALLNPKPVNPRMAIFLFTGILGAGLFLLVIYGLEMIPPFPPLSFFIHTSLHTCFYFISPSAQAFSDFSKRWRLLLNNPMASKKMIVVSMKNAERLKRILADERLDWRPFSLPAADGLYLWETNVSRPALQKLSCDGWQVIVAYDFKNITQYETRSLASDTPLFIFNCPDYFRLLL